MAQVLLRLIALGALCMYGSFCTRRHTFLVSPANKEHDCNSAGGIYDALSDDCIWPTAMLCRYNVGQVTVKTERDDEFSCIVTNRTVFQSSAKFCDFPKMSLGTSEVDTMMHVICDGFIIPQDYNFCVRIGITTSFRNKCSP
jgi:hypothetical protein